MRGGMANDFRESPTASLQYGSPVCFNGEMNLIKIGDCYLNVAGITHIELENEMRGLICTVHFNCQITDRDGSNGIQACKIFTGAAAKELKNILDKYSTLSSEAAIQSP
jgi:hypothetical protein